MIAKGIILLGGKGKRLKPLTDYFSKHLLPVYNKPMFYYSLSTLIYANIKEILIICNKKDLPIYKKIVAPISKKRKIKFLFEIQKNPGGGVAECLKIGSQFIKTCKRFVLILGDNFFFGREFPKILMRAINKKKSFVFLSSVNNPKNFGIAKFNKKNKLIKIIEKPTSIFSNLAVTGLYVYNSSSISNLKSIKRSKRGELEITSFNNALIKKNSLDYINLGFGITWFDLGSFSNLYECSGFVKLQEIRKGIQIAKII